MGNNTSHGDADTAIDKSDRVNKSLSTLDQLYADVGIANCLSEKHKSLVGCEMNFEVAVHSKMDKKLLNVLWKLAGNGKLR